MGLDTGTGRVSSFCLQEEKTPKVLGTPSESPNASKIWLRRRRHSFMPNLAYIPFNQTSSFDAPPNALALTTVNGMYEAEVDMRTIGWLLKAIFGASSVSSTDQATDGYIHTFIPGTSEKTFQVLENKGGFSSPYYRKYQGMFPNRMTFNTGVNDYLWASFGFLGLDEVTGTDPGTPAPEESDICVGFNQISYFIGASGSETIAAMGNAYTDIYDSRIDFTRPDAVADDFRSDGTGKSSSIFPGTFTPAINLMTRFASTHKLATFDARTRVSFGVRFDTGKIIRSVGRTYSMEFIFPKCTIQSDSVDMQGTGQAIPILQLLPEPVTSAGYSAKAILYNDRAAYTSPS